MADEFDPMTLMPTSTSTSYSRLPMPTLNDFEFLVLGLFRAPLAVAQSAVTGILDEHFPPGRFVTLSEPLNLSSVYERRPPLGGAHAKRAVLFEPRNAPGTTALIANLEDGWLTMCNAMSSAITGVHMLARSCVATDYPLTDFEVWEDGTPVRYVGALQDDPSWNFTARGEPRDFEELSNYKRRRVADRLSRDVLVEYLKKTGWDVASPEFWVSTRPAFYLREHDRRDLRG